MERYPIEVSAALQLYRLPCFSMEKKKKNNFQLDFFKKSDILTDIEKNGGLAQLVERWNHNPQVEGSSPPAATILR